MPRPSQDSLEHLYVNGFRYSIDDEWTERNLLSAPLGELEFLLDIHPAYVYRISLRSLRALQRSKAGHLELVRSAAKRVLCPDAALDSRLYPSLDGAPLHWDGLREQMTRRRWLQAMVAEAERLLSRPSMSNPDGDAIQPMTGLVSVAEDAAAKGTDGGKLYLPSLRPGQFQLPHLMTCGSLVRIGVRNSARAQFGPDSPLHVVEFSGQPYGDTVVTYLGEELRTGDMEVWGQLLKLATPLPLGSRVTIAARELLKALGRGTGGPAYAAVRGEIARLQGARLTVRSSHEPMREQFRAMFPDDPLSQSLARGSIEVGFQLLGPSSTDGSMWSVAIPREVRVAFGPRLSSWFSERDYGLLTRRREGDTVKRLFLLYRSHARPWPFTVPELRKYLGSTMARDSDLKISLDVAHDRLTSAGLIKSWRYGLSERRKNCFERVYEVDLAGP